MIISHQHKFIFIKTHKTAGTSIEAYLSPLCGAQDVFTPINPPVPPHQARNYRGLFNPLPDLLDNRRMTVKFLLIRILRAQKYHNHMPARLIRPRVGRKVWASYFKFCVERNPWDKTLSHLNYVNARRAQKLSLEEYFARGRFASDYDMYTDRDGRLMVDRVVRYEQLNEELQAVFDQLGLPFSGSLDVAAKSGFRKQKTSYRDIFSPEQAERIARAFEDEIRLLKYEF